MSGELYYTHNILRANGVSARSTKRALNEAPFKD